MTSFRPQEYYHPCKVTEAAEILAKYGEKARIIAGGTDLIATGPPGIECLVDIAGLGLDYIRKEKDGVKIGAGTPLHLIESSPLLTTEPYCIIAEAAGMIATPTVRNMATIGGNLCNASPAADLPPALMVLDAMAIITGTTGTRAMPLVYFFKDVNTTILSNGELLVEIHIPPMPTHSSATFHKLRHHQSSVDIAIVNAAARVDRADIHCREARIAMGAVAATPIRASKAEGMLKGQYLDGELIQKIADSASEEAQPIDDIRASADYRKKMAALLVRRALEDSARRCELWQS
jgi:carbon-monoxide dehydrogenase medium subunit